VMFGNTMILLQVRSKREFWLIWKCKRRVGKMRWDI
jgi:hypothetical protein